MGRSGEAVLFVAPRERRFLEDIEKATRQKIELLEFPSTEVLNDKRIANFKQKITDSLATEDTKLFYDIIDQYRQEQNVPAIDIAAALAKMVQGDDPLLLQERPKRKKDQGEKRSRDREDKRESRKENRPRRRSPRPGDEEMESYRIEVGRKHGVQAGNIVGAIANESGIDPDDIGRINIQDTYSLVDMQKGIPRSVWRMLKKV
ncbi:MAG: DbpA RNA binding domain-containing protein, partial [Calditrichaceae bacterium]